MRPTTRHTGRQSATRTAVGVIKIDTAIAGSRWAKMCLMHEMNHHYSGDFSHGVKFQAGMARLAMLGAFKGLW